ncbi:MAG: helix-turn-helix transcriptional regulator [Clostridia bacterium]|nr:helix-turn-helix transcriptional regulator [Clostridia bacterium]
MKSIIAQNIIRLRKNANMTQAELAEKLSYTDKAVSKWERGESIPDVLVLKKLADLFQVRVDDLLTEFDETQVFKQTGTGPSIRNHGFITGMSILLVWLIATLLFVIFESAPGFHGHWLAFIYAIPTTMIIWLIFNSVWFNRRRNFLIVSLLMWSVLGALYLNLLLAGLHIWLLFVLGIPGQIIILMWSGIRGKGKK